MADKYFTHKGVQFPSVCYSPEALSYVENEFQVRDDDIFNITYLKSGTNWILEILCLIRCDGDPGWVRSVLNLKRAPWVENHLGLQDALKYPPPRLLCSHLPIQLFPKSLQRSKAKVRGGRGGAVDFEGGGFRRWLFLPWSLFVSERTQRE
uniref:Sulfotransferase n=1 Tax=Chelydra serpentina TaxID=8475 RepID=A0A8C3SB46_CHESE